MLITTAVSSLKTAVELVKGIVSAKTADAVKEKAAELQNIILNLQATILSMQADYSQLLKEKEELEKKVAKRDEWQKIKVKYELKELSAGTFAYVLKAGTESGVHHWQCTQCFDEEKKSILQHKNTDYSYKHFICPACKSTFRLPLKNSPPKNA